MNKIKLTIGIITFTVCALLSSLAAGAQVNIDSIDLVGDSTFVEKIKGLDSEAASENAIYVSSKGSDSNEGTVDKPLKTINEALNRAEAGAVVYVRGGVYAENIYFPKSGREDAYIVLRNYPGESPVIKGTNKNDTPMIELDGNDYIWVEGFELCDYTAMWCYGIYFGGGENHIIIRNNTIHDIACLKPDDPDNSGANGILLFGETAEPISNVYIGDNYIYNLKTGWCEALSVTANCEYINVINNKVDNITNIGIDFYGNNTDGYCENEELNQPRYCVAAGNQVSNCVCDYATCYGLYADGARDIVIERNVSCCNMGGIEVGSEERNESYPVKNIVVKNNFVYNNTENGITVGGWNDGSDKEAPVSGVVYNTVVCGNTVVNNGRGSGGQLNIGMVDGVSVTDNVFCVDDDTPLVTSDVKESEARGVVFEGNLEIYLK